MQYAATFDFPVWLRPQDAALARDGVAHDGQVATRLGLAAIPVCAETVALSTILLLARETGARSPSVPAVERRRRGHGAPGQAPRPAGDLRRRDPSCAPVRNGHRLFRPQLPPHAAAAKPARPRRAASRRSPTARSTRCAPITRRSTRTPSSCRSAKPKPAPPALELLLPLTLKWAEETRLPLAQGSRASPRDPARVLGIDAGTLSAGRERRHLRLRSRALLEGRRAGARRARARTRRSSASKSKAGCATRWSKARSSTKRNSWQLFR